LKIIPTNVLFVTNHTKVNQVLFFITKQIIKILSINVICVESHFLDLQMCKDTLKLFILKLNRFLANGVERILDQLEEETCIFMPSIMALNSIAPFVSKNLNEKEV